MGTGGGYPVSNFTSKEVAFARRVCRMSWETRDLAKDG